MHAVHHQQQRRPRTRTQRCGDLADGQPDAAAGMHPGQPHRARPRPDAPEQGADDRIGAGRRRLLEQRNHAHARAGAVDRQPDRLMVRVMIVRGAQHLVPGLQRQPLVHQCQAGGGIAGQADILRPRAQVVGNFRLHLYVQVVRPFREHAVLDGDEGIAVDGATIAFDSRPHGGRMAGDEEAGEVHPLRIQRELGANGLPAGEVRHRRRLGLHGRQQATRQQDGGQGGRSRKEPASRDLHAHLPGAGPAGPMVGQRERRPGAVRNASGMPLAAIGRPAWATHGHRTQGSCARPRRHAAADGVEPNPACLEVRPRPMMSILVSPVRRSGEMAMPRVCGEPPFTRGA